MSDALLIHGGLVVRTPESVEAVDILIADGAIVSVERGLADRLAASPSPNAVRRLDASGRLVVPGFVTSHYHSHDVLLRGCFEPMPLEAWFMVGTPANYPKRSREEVKARTLLGALECLRGGITTVQDMSTVFPFDEDHVAAIMEAYDEIGIRATFAMQVADAAGQKGLPFWNEVVPEALRSTSTAAVRSIGDTEQLFAIVESQITKWRARHPRITWGLGPATPENCSTGFLQRVAALADRLDCRIFTHIYESKAGAVNVRRHYGAHGGSLIRYLDDIGMLTPRLTMAHCVWLLREEIDRIAARGAHVSLNPASNLKSRSGVAPIRDILDAGVRIGLGTDNCSCSDAQSMFQSMKLFCLLAAISHGDEGKPSAPQAVRAATSGSAAAVGLEGKVGEIAPGYRADLTLLDLSDPAFQPLNDPIRQLVYSECGRAVDTVIVDGEIVIEQGRATRIDQAALHETVARLLPGLQRDRDAAIARHRQFVPFLREVHERVRKEDIGTHRYVGPPPT